MVAKPHSDFPAHQRNYSVFVRGVALVAIGFAAVLIILAIWLL